MLIYIKKEAKIMRLAIISDIHSNLLALNLAMNDLKNQNINKIIFLGDYITDGENENEILNIIKSNSDYTILGNREKYILNYNQAKKVYNNYKPIHTTFNNLNKDNLNYIKSLKEFEIINLENIKILIIHGSEYYDNDKNINNMFDQIIDNYNFDICFFGHTHEYLYKKYKNKIFLNPGSIGIPVDYPTYKYCIVEIGKDINVSLKEFNIEDTFDGFSNKYKKTKYYHENYIWANLVLYSIKHGKAYCGTFTQLFNNKIIQIKNISVNKFNKIYNTTYKEFCKIFNLDKK